MPTIACQVSAPNQDCQLWRDFFATWHLDTTKPTNRAGTHTAATRFQEAGLYFPNVPIPPGSKIESAYLILRASEDLPQSGVSTYIEAEDNANPSPFSTLADYQARTKLTEVHAWYFLDSPWHLDTLYASPDFSEIIADIIKLPGWAEGNSIVLFWGDFSGMNPPDAGYERAAYSYDANPSEAPRLEITFTPPGAPPPPPPPPLPTPPPPPRKGWAGLDLQYEYMDDGFKLTYYTDVPCHLFCRMTTTPPRRHSLPSMRRGLRMTGDIRFCFVVYEDNEQEEPGDTLIHTWIKDAWPVCQTRWFYFIGHIYGDPSPSESPIFKFHFPTWPPPLPYTQICHADPLGVTATSASARYRFAQVIKPYDQFRLTHLVISLGRNPTAPNYPPAEGFIALHYVDASNLPIDPPIFQVDFTIAVPEIGIWYPFTILTPHTDLYPTVKYGWVIGSNYSLDPACRYLIERGAPGPCDTIDPWWYSYSRWNAGGWSAWTRFEQHQYRYQMWKFT